LRKNGVVADLHHLAVKGDGLVGRGHHDPELVGHVVSRGWELDCLVLTLSELLQLLLTVS
jgi:hypothetical protein